MTLISEKQSADSSYMCLLEYEVPRRAFRFPAFPPAL